MTQRILFGIAVLSISLLTTTIETPGKDQSGFSRSPNQTGRVADTAQLRRTSNQFDVRIHPVSSSKRDLQRVIKAALKRCSCACPTATLVSFGSCFGGCLERHGVSTVTAAGCVALCTANPVGCAVCAGVQQWIVMGCAQYCVWRDVFFAAESGLETRNRGLRSNRLHAKRLIRSLKTVSPS